MNNEHHALYDFKELMVSKFKITGCVQTRRREVEDGNYEHCRKKKIVSTT